MHYSCFMFYLFEFVLSSCLDIVIFNVWESTHTNLHFHAMFMVFFFHNFHTSVLHFMFFLAIHFPLFLLQFSKKKKKIARQLSSEAIDVAIIWKFIQVEFKWSPYFALLCWCFEGVCASLSCENATSLESQHPFLISFIYFLSICFSFHIHNSQ